MTSKPHLPFYTLILVVAIGGMNQGLTLPLLSVLLDQAGVSSVVNGFSSTGLYLGILLVSPFMEIPVRRFGYRTTILAGLCLVTAMTLLFPVFHGAGIWFLLRFLLGVGDVALHYASQLWITAIAPQEKRGRWITFYGFAYGAGFSIGPLGMLLLPYGIWWPFLALSAFYIAAFTLLMRLKNDYPAAVDTTRDEHRSRYRSVFRLAWLALLPSFLYGYLETALNVNMPVYFLHEGFSVETVAYLTIAFTVGGLLLQLPLGTWSDRIGRKKMLLLAAAVGGACLIALPLAGNSLLLILALLGLAGGAVGSFYSLGMAYAADILPAGLIATAGAIMSMNYSIASILAPNINGALLNSSVPQWMFWILGGMLLLFFLSAFFFRRRSQQQSGPIPGIYS